MTKEDKKLLEQQALAEFVEKMCGWIKANAYYDLEGSASDTVDSHDLIEAMSEFSGIGEDQLFIWFDKAKR